MNKYITAEELLRATEKKVEDKFAAAAQSCFPRKVTLQKAVEIERDIVVDNSIEDVINFTRSMASPLSEADMFHFISFGSDSQRKANTIVSAQANTFSPEERRKQLALLLAKADQYPDHINSREQLILKDINKNIIEILEGNMNRTSLNSFVDKAQRFFTGKATAEDLQGETIRFAGSFSKSMDSMMEQVSTLTDDEAEFLKSVVLEAAEDAVWGPYGHLLAGIDLPKAPLANDFGTNSYVGPVAGVQRHPQQWPTQKENPMTDSMGVHGLMMHDSIVANSPKMGMTNHISTKPSNSPIGNQPTQYFNTPLGAGGDKSFNATDPAMIDSMNQAGGYPGAQAVDQAAHPITQEGMGHGGEPPRVGSFGFNGAGGDEDDLGGQAEQIFAQLDALTQAQHGGEASMASESGMGTVTGSFGHDGDKHCGDKFSMYKSLLLEDEQSSPFPRELVETKK